MPNKTFAVIKTGGKQYLVEEGAQIAVEKLSQKEGSEVRFGEVLLYVEGNTVQIGTPFVLGLEVRGKILSNSKAEKVTAFKFKRRKRYSKTKGHRQPYTLVEITNIGGKSNLSAESASTAKSSSLSMGVGASKSSAEKPKIRRKTAIKTTVKSI